MQELVFALLRAAICEQPIAEEIKEQLDDVRLSEIYDLAKKHAIAPLIADVLFNYNLLPDGEVAEKYRISLWASVIQQQKQSHELAKISHIFEENKIPYLPLKGSVLRNYYPEPWLRTCCDIDILVLQKDLDRAIETLKNKDYQFTTQSAHDVSLTSQSGVHVELHHTTLEKSRVRNANAALTNIWEYATVENGTYGYVLNDAMFYFYHLAHMAKHIEVGGCGIRAFMDLWILNHKVPFDKAQREALLEQGNLGKFAKLAEHLSEVWFSGAEQNKQSLLLQEYILSGGVYGTLTNKVAMQQQKQGGKIQYLLQRIVMPYESLCSLYPILYQHKWLLPLMQVRRWGKLIFCGGFRRSTNEIKTNQIVSEETKSKTKELWEALGL